mmetsp:Transcript_5843/g.14242  ORF Transcript_5843/g.14242 Transcript_5843/m.14242 type:complete len:123 (+) Transcript_5843:189-557(+)
MALRETSDFWLRVAGFSGALAVGLGAFGAHGLKARVTDAALLKVWDTGAQYHLVHSLGIGLAAVSNNGRPSPLAAACFAGGIVLFSGSLYTITLTGNRKLGMVAPIGGLAYMAGWTMLALRK